MHTNFKGIIHPKIIIFTHPPCHSKPVWFNFSLWNTKEDIFLSFQMSLSILKSLEFKTTWTSLAFVVWHALKIFLHFNIQKLLCLWATLCYLNVYCLNTSRVVLVSQVGHLPLVLNVLAVWLMSRVTTVSHLHWVRQTYFNVAFTMASIQWNAMQMNVHNVWCCFHS